MIISYVKSNSLSVDEDQSILQVGSRVRCALCLPRSLLGTLRRWVGHFWNVCWSVFEDCIAGDKNCAFPSKFCGFLMKTIYRLAGRPRCQKFAWQCKLKRRRKGSNEGSSFFALEEFQFCYEEFRFFWRFYSCDSRRRRWAYLSKILSGNDTIKSVG